MRPKDVVSHTASRLAHTSGQFAALDASAGRAKVERMVARTIIGGLLVLVGLLLLGLLVVLPALEAWRSHVAPSVLVLVLGLGFGVGLVVLGATVWSSQLVREPLVIVVATFRGLWDAYRGRPPQ